MAHLENRFEQGRTVEFLFNPSHYAGFSLDSEQHRVVGCIDPRPEERARHKIIVQTPGGGVGIAHDVALVSSALRGAHYRPQECLRGDPVLDTGTILTAHQRCAYDLYTENVFEEMIAPSALTRGILNRLQNRYIDATDFQKSFDMIRATAEKALPFLREHHEARVVLSSVDALYPEKQTVTDMQGENKAGVYTISHHPNVGLDREQMHRGPHPLEVQSYFDCVQATLNLVRNTPRLSEHERQLRTAALLLRSAATPGVLLGEDTRFKILEVESTSQGISVQELDRAELG